MSPKNFTHELLIGWGGEKVFAQGLRYGNGGSVMKAEWDPATHKATGVILYSNGAEQRTGFTLFDDGHILSDCPCKTNQEFAMVCPHVVALALVLMYRMNDPEAEAKHQAELRTARRVAEVDPRSYIQRNQSGPRMRVQLTWGRDFVREFYAGGVQAHLALVDEAGVRHAPEEPALREGVHLSKGDDNLLSVLEDVCAGPATSDIKLVPGDFLNIVAMRTQAARVRCVLKAEYFEEDGQFELFPWAELPFEHIASADRFLVHGSTGFVWTTPLTEQGEGTPRFVPLANVLKGPFQSIYKHDEVIPRAAMPAFIRDNLPVLRQQIEVQMSPSEEFFRFVPDVPVIHVKLSGSRASVSAQLFARYGEQEVGCGVPAGPDAVCRPDPDDMLCYHVRNMKAEQAAFKTLAKLGFEPSDSDRWFITEPRDVLNFLGSGEPRMRRMGWKVTCSDRLSQVFDELPRIVPVVDVSDAPGGSFEVGYTFEAGSRIVPQAEIQGAINRGDSYLMTGGGTYLLNIDAVQEIRGVFADCSETGSASRPGHFRLPRVYAPYVRGALTSFDELDFEDEAAPSWREVSATREKDEDAKFEPVDLGRLEGVLRPYQKQGVYWMRFLERSGLSGLLADEMGLGKTLQTLTWISLERTDPAARGKPALVVCPTSLVQNWNAEAEKFTPWLKRLVVSGPDRAAAFAHIPEADLVITSYALLQRDLADAYLERTFSVIVLDEAQHIKNRSTRNAKSAKRLNGLQKLVLTGTPVENSVADVWSIFDFLLPDYLGAYDSFNARVEQPIACGGEEGQAAQERLRHKLRPFILRRLKQTVAKDLPEKIVKVAYCPMTPEQQSWYNRLLAEAKGKIGNMVKEKGFAKSKFEILALLMRLRQVSCHLELLKEYREKNPPLSQDVRARSPSAPQELSGKLEVFFEMLDEAMDGGHRVLVFSQFVTMLTILRNELEARNIPYCYLDGSTKDRLGECRKFNTDESIPVFLISLHAGGTGLNLTGADMVVHFDPWWNPAVEDQATDRAHRIGQKRTVYVVKMIAENSVEERVLALQQKKQAVIDATVGTTDVQLMEKLTYDDVKSIVGI